MSYFRTYLESSARKKVQLPERIHNKLKNDKERPKSGTLKEIQRDIIAGIEQQFAIFWEVKIVDSKIKIY